MLFVIGRGKVQEIAKHCAWSAVFCLIAGRIFVALPDNRKPAILRQYLLLSWSDGDAALAQTGRVSGMRRENTARI
jgi:hypothetical protein